MRRMAMYLLKRLGQTIIVLLIVCVATFFMVDLVPGDPVYTVAGSSDLDQAEYDAIYYQLHLDKSTGERFLIWMRDALHGDFGTSYSYSMPVIQVIRERLPYTLFFSILTLVISVPIGVRIANATAPAIECPVLMNSILKHPSVTVSPGSTSITSTSVSLCSSSLCRISALVNRVP